MDLLQLRYFRVVARLEHMTKAPRSFFIAQPSLSQTIGRLEKEIGVPLFDRHGRVIRLNQFGKAFLEHVETLFRELEEGQRKVQDMAGTWGDFAGCSDGELAPRSVASFPGPLSFCLLSPLALLTG